MQFDAVLLLMNSLESDLCRTYRLLCDETFSNFKNSYIKLMMQMAMCGSESYPDDVGVCTLFRSFEGVIVLGLEAGMLTYHIPVVIMSINK